MQTWDPPLQTTGRVLFGSKQMVSRIGAPRTLPASRILVKYLKALDALPKKAKRSAKARLTTANNRNLQHTFLAFERERAFREL